MERLSTMVARKNSIGLVLALLLSILMASMDNTIVATAMGDIVGKLGGLDKFVWVTSAYMVAEMAGMPIFGKLSDMYGRKKFFVFGIIVFMLGSALMRNGNVYCGIHDLPSDSRYWCGGPGADCLYDHV